MFARTCAALSLQSLELRTLRIRHASRVLVAFAELEADMHRHVHTENNVLFPRALRIVGELVREGRTAEAMRCMPLLCAPTPAA